MYDATYRVELAGERHGLLLLAWVHCDLQDLPPQNVNHREFRPVFVAPVEGESVFSQHEMISKTTVWGGILKEINQSINQFIFRRHVSLVIIFLNLVFSYDFRKIC